MQFDQIVPHIQAVRQYAKENERNSDFADPQTWLAGGAPLRILCVEDYGTRGLIGPEHSLEVQRFPKPHCFLGLCRNIGDSQKSCRSNGWNLWPWQNGVMEAFALPYCFVSFKIANPLHL